MRVVVADDSVLLREGVVRVLTDDGHEVVAAVGDGATLIDAVEALRPDLAVVDVRMPPDHTDEGIQATRRLRESSDTAILLLSQYLDVGAAIDLLSTNPRGLGYLLKDRVLDIDDFLDACRRVAGGGTAIDPDIISVLVTPPARVDDPLALLTDRERTVLGLMAQGLSNQALADHLHIGLRTVETHVNAVFWKLQLAPTTSEHRRVLAVLTYLRSTPSEDRGD